MKAQNLKLKDEISLILSWSRWLDSKCSFAIFLLKVVLRIFIFPSISSNNIFWLVSFECWSETFWFNTVLSSFKSLISWWTPSMFPFDGFLHFSRANKKASRRIVRIVGVPCTGKFYRKTIAWILSISVIAPRRLFLYRASWELILSISSFDSPPNRDGVETSAKHKLYRLHIDYHKNVIFFINLFDTLILRNFFANHWFRQLNVDLNGFEL